MWKKIVSIFVWIVDIHDSKIWFMNYVLIHNSWLKKRNRILIHNMNLDSTTCEMLLYELLLGFYHFCIWTFFWLLITTCEIWVMTLVVGVQFNPMSSSLQEEKDTTKTTAWFFHFCIWTFFRLLVFSSFIYVLITYSYSSSIYWFR